MITFNDIHKDIIPVLKTNGVTEKDLFNYHSDLYIGCKTFDQARKIAIGGIWRAMSDVFNPQSGSDMNKYPVAVDIAFGYVGYFNKK